MDPSTVATATTLEAISARSFVNMPPIEDGGFVALPLIDNVKPRQ